jgi:glycosyltransferase involved in cell wall biosynthesis
METTTRTGPSTDEPVEQSAEPRALPVQRQVIGRFLPRVNGNRAKQALNGSARPSLAVFCHESPDSYIGGHVLQMVQTLVNRGQRVELFSRHPFTLDGSTFTNHVVGAGDTGEITDQVQEYGRRAGTAFLERFSPAEAVRVIGYEWSSVPALALVRETHDVPTTLSLHSLERQRTQSISEVGRQIEALEVLGLQQAHGLLIHDPATAELARQVVPECADRVTHAHHLFPISSFDLDLDPGEIKARYQIGPIDPTILYVGDMNDRYGPDVIVKAMPALLRHQKQLRLVVVGDGELFWPLRVYTRYLLLEHAVRLPGHIQDQPLNELFRASDMVVVPSRESTPWWPILAGWAARRPVVATHNAAPGLLVHEEDAVLCYPNENSYVWGIERVLFDAGLREKLALNGRKKLEARFGWNGLAEQIEELTGLAVSAEAAAQ